MAMNTCVPLEGWPPGYMICWLGPHLPLPPVERLNWGRIVAMGQLHYISIMYASHGIDLLPDS